MITALEKGLRLVVRDDGPGTLAPLTDLRAAFDVRTGAMTTLERVLQMAGLDSPDALLVPGSIEGVVRESHPGVAVNEVPAGECLLVSARWLVPSGLGEMAPNSAMTDGSGHVLAMRAESSQIESFLVNGAMPRGIANRPVGDALVLEFAWDVVRHRDSCLAHDLGVLSERIPFERDAEGVTMIEAENIFVHRDARVLPSAMLDASAGPIVIDEGATVRLGATLIGPVYVGRGSTVLDQALIKGGTAIGPVCKVAGEMGGTIVQGFTNKAHDGHVGDSWLGEWVNLGAGTMNSNLLNTYGQITCTSGGIRHRTGLTFLGTIAGDHAKTAIGTRLMTGGILGTGSMVASSVPPPSETARFAWITDERLQTYRVEKFLDVMRTVMGRRGITPGEAYVERICSLAGPGGAGA